MRRCGQYCRAPRWMTCRPMPASPGDQIVVLAVHAIVVHCRCDKTIGLSHVLPSCQRSTIAFLSRASTLDEHMSGQQWFALAPWGREYLAALREWELGMRKDRPWVDDFRPTPTPSMGPLQPFSLRRKRR
jgi:hypothetical protein